MKRLFLLLGLLVLVGCVIAPGTDYDDDDSGVVEKIELEVDGDKLEWDVEGYSENGFKVVWSKNEGPTYPLREGDKYHYYSDPERDWDTLEAFDGDGEYYVRVCEYLGGKCGVYSNEVLIDLSEEDKVKSEYEEKYEYEEKEKYEYEEKEGEVKEKYEYEKEGEAQNDGSCNGCLVDGKCYYFTHRMDGQYCSYEGGFVNQSVEGVACENNFECKSNICAGSECVDAGLVRKVLNWLKNFFG